MSEIIDRIKSETPLFFKKVRSFGLYLMATGFALIATPEGVVLPEIIKTGASYAVAVGFVMSTLAQFAKEDKPVQ